MPSDHDVATCPSCHARIRWTITVNAKRQPINADPDAAGNLAVYRDGTGTLRSRVLTTERPTLEHAEWRAMPHVATCTGPALRRQDIPPRRPVRRPVLRRQPWQRWPR
ncbi:hypothetical protein BX257_4774 [Streptomyces sp. 3212.3]|uniref:hypothetical protein n=1 Tax=Streptomyces sp. 3212.3 TaxID=1938846 RepID=UPI000E21E999|nr:hypothetical protein [Streptomyces sp. 3212.3]REE62161.1 hypothetical protein BX257_4774 [Streptomyces sp. 3212.3]